MWSESTQERLDLIPRLYETEHLPIKDKLIYLHFFIGGCDWYIAEYDGDDVFFGYAILSDTDCAEWGYVSFTELKKISIHVTGRWCDENGHAIAQIAQLQLRSGL